MNCPNCGAAMTLAPNHDYFVCVYCATYHFPEPTKDYVRVLAEPVGLPCPLCHDALVTGSIEGTRVFYCTRCRGILVNRMVFGQVMTYLRSRATNPPVAPRPVDLSQLERRLHCPQCDRMMDVHPYYGPGNIVIDACGACHLLWLDHGELSSVIDAPGRDRRQ